MGSFVLDAYIAPMLMPTIMVISSYKQLTKDEPNLLYVSVTAGTVLSTLFSTLHVHIHRTFRSRRQLTYLTALQITSAAVVSVLLINIIRLNFANDEYELPYAIRTQPRKDSSHVFRYHFFADMIPGIIILSKIQLSAMLKYDLLNKAKRTFSYGESTIVSQLFSTVYLVWALTTYSKLSGAGPFQVNLTTDIILNIGSIVTITIFLPSYLFLSGRSVVTRYSLLGLCLFASYTACKTLISASSSLDPFTWLVDHIFSTHQRISLFSLWLSTVAACVSFATSWTRMVGETNSLVRKVFHLAICVVFVSGFNQDIDFARFAGGGAIIIFFILELVRAWNLPPMGSHLEKVCHSLRGKWDNRYVTLSHIYLLVGTFLPIWLLPSGSENQNKLILSSGLISVGVGDTVAAVVGTLFGKTKVGNDSGKTVEGLAANMFAMVLVKMIWVGYTSLAGELSFIITAIVTAFVEVSTINCDNLVLPLVMTLFIQLFCSNS